MTRILLSLAQRSQLAEYVHRYALRFGWPASVPSPMRRALMDEAITPDVDELLLLADAFGTEALDICGVYPALIPNPARKMQEASRLSER